MKPLSTVSSERITTKNIVFALLTFILVLLTHAIAYLLYEYSHSFLAWITGFKTTPFALDYGHPTLRNIILFCWEKLKKM